MKTVHEVSSNKLRGGFYTPAPLVDMCLDRVAALWGPAENLRVLEPSAGDGVFLRRLARHPLATQIGSFTGLEIVEAEAAKCRSLAQDTAFPSTICTTSAVSWATIATDKFDVVVGNPPFVRFQFVSPNDVNATKQLGLAMGVSFRGVTNLWVPVLLGALHHLRAGGVMAVVVPAEVLTGLASGDARAWLLANFTDLQIDLFEPGSFPDVLQEIVIISGRKANRAQGSLRSSTRLDFVEHLGVHVRHRWTHGLPHTSESWTRYLLTPDQLAALAAARKLSGVQRFGDVAKLEVSIVTGANDFFSVTAEECERFQLHQWTEPLLPRIRYADELVYAAADHARTAASGAKAWLLNFSAQRPDPRAVAGPARYLDIGELQGLDTRYKTALRSPWYRVPAVWSGTLLLSKRSHRFPRLVYNAAQVVTTDTIYRGSILPLYVGREMDLVAAFHNSLTLLTAEVEGRSFGGGVLELVPSEIARLTVPFPVDLTDAIPQLRQFARMTGTSATTQELLVEKTDSVLCDRLAGLTPDLMQLIQEARWSLLSRRLSRN
ncbi:MAG: N-6 DNA methylase [Chloroflexota bacterium]|nr:N-6 DNA methylase [Chloroflexota bacterium]